MADQKRHFPPPSPSQAAGQRGSRPPAYSAQPPHVAPAPQAPPGWPQQQQPAIKKPSAYWPLSIIAVVMFPLFGFVPVIFSARVGSKWNSGDVRGANSASQVALFSSIGVIVLCVLFLLVVIAGSGSSGY